MTVILQFEESNSIKVFAKAGDIVYTDVSIETRVTHFILIMLRIKFNSCLVVLPFLC